MIRFFVLTILLASGLQAATYYVAKTGNNSNAGTSQLPWATVAKAATTMVAGDTCIVRDGDYDEYVDESTSGTAIAPITYQAENQHGASIKAFRFRGQYIVVNGFAFRGYSGVNNLWSSTARFESTGDNCTITNCLFTDYPQVKANDVSFNAATSRIISPSSDFIGAGFRVGSKFYLGASGVIYGGGPLYYANHDRLGTIQALSATEMTVTFADGLPMIADAGTNYWAYIYASGTNQLGNSAILCVQSGGNGPDSCTATNNTMTRWYGNCISVLGDNWLIEGNRMVDNSAASKGIVFNGSSHIIRRNYLKGFKQPLYYSDADMATIFHPEGTGWYDFITQMLSAYVVTTAVQTDNLIEENWLEDLESPIGRIDDEMPDTYGIIFNRNVFIGVAGAMDGGRDDMEWTDNTFYRSGYNGNSPLQLGGRPPQQTGYVITGNLYVACGERGASSDNGWHGVDANALSPVLDYNFVCNEEVTGYASKPSFSEPNSINGGNPIFYNVMDYDGPDNLPFTDDDGLKVLANSPVAALGGGALGVRPVTTGQPVAHFRLTSPNGWFEPVDESYDPTWDDVPPTQRTGYARHWDTPVTIGTAPVAVTFSAADSISGVGGAATAAAITTYTWSFAGAAGTGQTPSYTFTTGGTKTVTLTVTNSAGNTHTTSRVYRVLGESGDEPPTLSAPSAVQNVRVIVN